MNEHLSPRARTVVACIGIRQRAKGVQHFIAAYRRDPDTHYLSAGLYHARSLRERSSVALADARADAAKHHDERGRADARGVG